jgi:hypothetical protein
VASPFIAKLLASVKQIGQTAADAIRRADTAVRTSREAAAQAKANERALERAKQGTGDLFNRDAKSAQGIVSKSLQVVNRAVAVGNTLGDLLTPNPNRSTFSTGLSLIQQAGPAFGAPGAIAAAVASGLKAIDARMEEARRKIDEAAAEAQQRRIRQADEVQRYEDDPRYKQEVDEQARKIYIAERNAGWEPRSSTLTEGLDW